jgi:hypothetical protein
MVADREVHRERPGDNGQGLNTRVTLLEAKVRLITLVLEGMIIAFFTALIAYFFKGN